MNVYVINLKQFNFDDCDSYTKSTIGVKRTHAEAIYFAEEYVSGWCDKIEWNEHQIYGKANISSEIEIVEFKEI